MIRRIDHECHVSAAEQSGCAKPLKHINKMPAALTWNHLSAAGMTTS
jgi:hypothetical protein